MKIKIKKGDKVLIAAGKDRGKNFFVERVFPKENKVLIAGANIFKKHLKPKGEGKPGGIIEIPRPLFISKLILICPKCNQPTKVGFFRQKDEGKSLRICKKCQAQF